MLINFNARVGCESAARQGIIGRHGWASVTATAYFYCAVYCLLITHTTYCLPICNKTSYMHLCSKHLIDYVNGRTEDMQDVKVTKTKCVVDP